ncbi:MAG: hypothetical protein GY852_11280 [bacterium]|nr:hypothetical protein [bacterium]
MRWWSDRKSKPNGTYTKVRDADGKLVNGFGKTEEIPRMILDGLNSQKEGTARMRIGSLAGENNYNKTDICEHLIRLIQRDGRDTVVNLASGAFVNVLKGIVNTDTVILLIKKGLFAKNEKNAEVFVSMLEETGCSISLRKCAVEMLAGFAEKDVSAESMDMIEAALFEAYENPKENDEIRKLIKHRFGPNRKGRPKVIVEQEREDETVAIGPEHERETEALDVLSGWIGMLKHPDEKRRDVAARSLSSMAEQSSDRKKVERIINAFRDGGPEFFAQFRKARDTLLGMGPNPENGPQKSTLPPEPKGPKRDSGEPTVRQKLKR